VSRRETESNALIAFCQGNGRNAPLCEKLEFALDRFGFNWGLTTRDAGDHKIHNYWLKMNKEGRASKLSLIQRFLHLVRPTKWRDRLIGAATSGRLYTSGERVVSIQDDGCETVYGL